MKTDQNMAAMEMPAGLFAKFFILYNNEGFVSVFLDTGMPPLEIFFTDTDYTGICADCKERAEF